MKKNILNAIFAICIISFSTVAMAQSKSAKPKTSAAKPKAKVRNLAPPPMEERAFDSPPPPAMEERVAPPPAPPDYYNKAETPDIIMKEMRSEPPPPINNEPREEEVFSVVEQQAEFPGGQASMFNWLAANIKYPAVARENNIQGKVILRMIIEKDGTINGVMVLSGANELLNKEAVRVVKEMPKWTAGKQRGNLVRSYFTLPVVFKLETAAPSIDKK